MNNGKRAPSRAGARSAASGGAAVDALAPAGKKKVLKQPSVPDANGAAKALPARAGRAAPARWPPRAARRSRLADETIQNRSSRHPLFFPCQQFSMFCVVNFSGIF